jgi:hypothetical protein
MVLKIKSQKQRIIDRQEKLARWHRKWAWWPTCIETSDNGSSTWVWMRFYYRKIQTTMDYRYLTFNGNRYYYLRYIQKSYALDDFELIKSI